MNHVSEQQLVELFFEEGAEPARKHLSECSVCGSAFEALTADLRLMRAEVVPERGADYGDLMGRRVASHLPRPVRAPRRTSGFVHWQRAGLAAACAGLLASAFYVGRVWEQNHRPIHHLQRAATVVQPSMVVVVLGDHLERSERLLVELKHADSDDAELVTPLREEARKLLAENQGFRAGAEKAGDPALMKGLGDLDQILKKVAEEPGGLNAANLQRLQRQMKADGLLFEVRVLRAKGTDRQTTIHVPAKGGDA